MIILCAVLVVLGILMMIYDPGSRKSTAVTFVLAALLLLYRLFLS